MSELQDLFEAKHPMPNGITRCGDHYSQTRFVLSGDAGDYCAKFDGFKEAWQEQQKRIEELEIHQEKQSECIKNLVSQRNSASSMVESSLILIENFFDDQVQTPTPRQYANFIQEIYEALKGGDE